MGVLVNKKFGYARLQQVLPKTYYVRFIPRANPLVANKYGRLIAKERNHKDVNLNILEVFDEQFTVVSCLYETDIQDFIFIEDNSKELFLLKLKYNIK